MSDSTEQDPQQAVKSAKFKSIMGASALVCLVLAAIILTFGMSFGMERGVVLLVAGALVVTAGFDYLLMKSADKIVATGRKSSGE